MNGAIIVSVLALVVAASAVAASITCAFRTIRLAADSSALQQQLNDVRQRIERTSTTALAAEVDALRGAVDAQRIAHRKELGSIWGRIGADASHVKTFPGEMPDDDLQSFLALQSAPAAGPNNGGR